MAHLALCASAVLPGCLRTCVRCWDCASRPAINACPPQDDNDAAPYNQLPTFIVREEHSHMLEGLRSHNKVARGSAIGMLLLCSFNLLISLILLLTPPSRGGRFNGTRTLTTLVSNVLLLSRRVVQNARISHLSMREDLALSLYQMKARAFCLFALQVSFWQSGPDVLIM